MIMNDAKEAELKLVAKQLEVVRTKLRATGASVLSPTAEWVALRKEMLELTRKLK